ncbi:MAG: TIGR03790 family protein [Methylophaga sp.]|nr:MAG: TIGR03790 family protein [Methylophaga sp.]
MITRIIQIIGVLALSIVFSTLALAKTLPEVQLPSKLSGHNVLVLYKEFNSFSQQIAQYYAEKRHIPSAQVVPVAIFRNPDAINQQKFESITTQLSPHLTDNIKVIVLAWHAPYRVDCMSITSAFALGFDKKYCSHPTKKVSGCHKTANSPYFNNVSSMLWKENPPLRLSMMLSGETLIEAKELIDRGVAADATYPIGNAYLVRTHDTSRSARWPIFKQFSDLWGERKGLRVQYIDDRWNKTSTQITNKQNVLFYHTGLTRVPAIKTNHYLPGAIADHLTSVAGMGIGHSGQMKAFRWLEAGVTGSYGAVVEPCNFIEKFPNPQVLIPTYRYGDTLIEAYWKSVQQPGEGLFVGEPLARPWSKTRIEFNDKTLVIYSQELNSNMSYRIEAQQDESSSWEKVRANFYWSRKELKIHIPHADAERYRILENK